VQQTPTIDTLRADAVAMTVHDGRMTGGNRVLVWGSAITGGLALIALGAYFVGTGLNRADKLASVIGAFAALIGLGMSVYGVVLTRRSRPQSAGQTVAGSTVGGEVLQVHGVQGSLHIGQAADPPSSSPPSTPKAAPANQSVIGTHTSGRVRQFDGIGGDAEIDR